MSYDSLQYNHISILITWYVVRFGSSGDVALDLQNYLRLSMPRGASTLPSANRPTAAARPRHARPTRQPYLGVPGERRGTAAKFAERGRWESALPGTCSVPGKGGDPWEGTGFHSFRRHFPSRVSFTCPRLWVSICMEGGFSGDETLSSPRGFFFHLRLFLSQR